MSRSLCAVVAKVRIEYLGIKVYDFWGANEKKKVRGNRGSSHAHFCRSNGVWVVLGMDLAMCYCNAQQVELVYLIASCSYLVILGQTHWKYSNSLAKGDRTVLFEEIKAWFADWHGWERPEQRKAGTSEEEVEEKTSTQRCWTSQKKADSEM